MKLKVITLNIWHGGRLWDNAVEFLKAEDPDILLLQGAYDGHNPELEARLRTVDEFKRTFTFKDVDFAPALNQVFDFGKVKQGSAIFSKLPIIKSYEPVFFNEPYDDNYVSAPERFPMIPRNLEHVVIDVAGSELDVLNFHGVWDLDGENDSPKRLQMSKTIIDALKDRPLVVLGGDANVRPNTQTIRNIEEHLTNVFAGELKTTFNIKQKTDPKLISGYASSVVDMLFVSPDIKVVEHYCPEVDVSDHLPLVMTIELPEAA